MNPPINLKVTNIPSVRNPIGPPSAGRVLLIPLVLVCLALAVAASAFGVIPALDGGYPGFNTAEGDGALFSLTTGLFNTANGNVALYSNTMGSSNTATG